MSCTIWELKVIYKYILGIKNKKLTS
jgi:hypothetical protein